MKINKNNYEAFFLDYLEGNLDESLVDDFIEFIRQNPDLKEELALFDSVKLKPEDLSFDKKDKLYKEIYDNEDELNRAAIANLEGDISDEEKSAFENYLSRHPAKQKEAELFSLTKLQADKTIVFSKKGKLLRKSAGKVFLLWAGRVAAVLIIALSVYILADRPAEEVVQNEKVADSGEKSKAVETARESIASVVEEAPNTAEVREKTTEVESDKKKEFVMPKVAGINAAIKEEQTEKEQIAIIRIPVEVPQRIVPENANLNVSNNNLTLVPVNEYFQNIPENFKEEQFIADVVKEKTGIDNLSLNKITRAGLKLVSAISKDKFSYETNDNGKVTEVNFDSRLLAFSIPTQAETK